jgi:hypothetical protein
MTTRISFLIVLVAASACASEISDASTAPDVSATDLAGAQAQSYGGSAAPIVVQPEPGPEHMPSDVAIEPQQPQADAAVPMEEPKPAQTTDPIARVLAGSGGSMGAAGAAAPMAAGAGGSVAGAAGSTAGAGAGGAGGSASAPVGITQCKLASKQVIACDAFSKQYFPSWVLHWTVAQGAGSVTYNCQGDAPKCVAGSKCTVTHVDTGVSEMGVCQ